MKEDEYLYPTNFLFSISPDGRIESIKTFGGNAEGDDEAGVIKTLFEATLQSRRVSPDLHDRLGSGVMVSIFPDGRFKAFRVSNTPLEKWTPNHHKSQNVTLMAAFSATPNSQAISDVEIAPEDPEAEKKHATVQKMGEVIPVRPGLRKDWSKINAAFPHLQEFAGWFGNAKRIPLSIDDENYDLKMEALEDAGYIFSPVGNVWLRR